MTQKYTSDELTQLHKELYEILDVTIQICKKHHIPYFAIGGTAIGALYDEAILPWDDDVDIGMKREDYNRFLEVAPKELGEKYFLSWMETDPHTPYYFAKVKKNHTLFVETMFKDVPMHPGIFVDIFPFDKIPDNKLLQKIQYNLVNFLNCCLMGKEVWLWRYAGKCAIDNPSNRGPLPCYVNKLIDKICSKRCIFKMLQGVQQCFNSTKTSRYNNTMTRTDHVLNESLARLQERKFGPIAISVPDDLEGFLRYNYPKLHRFTEEEIETVNNHYPAAFSFDTRSE